MRERERGRQKSSPTNKGVWAQGVEQGEQSARVSEKFLGERGESLGEGRIRLPHPSLLYLSRLPLSLSLYSCPSLFL